MAKIIKISIFGIFCLAVFLRMYHLDSVPPSLSLDEVSLGWNAYSLLKIGRDEYGTPFPVLLRAYDDYRPALYAYAIVPFLPVFGLTSIAVRMPAIVFSVVSIFFTFVFVKVISKNIVIAVTSAFLLSISPWHIYISRLGHEANAGLSFGILGVAFFFLFLSTKRKFLYFSLSWLCFVCALYSYQSQKIIIPIIVGSLLIFFLKDFLKYRKIVLIVSVIAIILLIPLIIQTVSGDGLIRFRGTSIFTQFHPLYEKAKEEFVFAKQEGNVLKQIINYPRLTPFRIIEEQYLLHFSYSWLFRGQAYEAHKVPFTGLLYSWELPFILMGIFVSSKILERRVFLFLLIWFLSSPLPAAMTTQAPHAMRSYTFLPLWQIFGAFGIVYAAKMLRHQARIIGGVIFCLLIVVHVRNFFMNYFHVFPMTQSDSFSYAVADAMRYVDSKKNLYEKIVISNILGDRYQYPSYMFFLFYTRFDPHAYFLHGGTKSGNFQAKHMFGKYEFRPIHSDERRKNTLYVDNYVEALNGKTIQYIARYLDGRPGVVMYTYE